MDDKLIAVSPKRPSEDPDAQPPNVAGVGCGGLEFREQVRAIGVAPTTTSHLAEVGLKELHRDAGEEDVVSILHRATQEADPISRSIMLKDLHPRREASPDPLP